MTTSTKSLLCTVFIPLKGHFSFSRTVYKWAKSESQLTNGPESLGICSKYNHTARHFSVSSLSAVLLWSRNEHSRFFKSGFFNNRSEFSLKKIKTAFWSKERCWFPSIILTSLCSWSILTLSGITEIFSFPSRISAIARLSKWLCVHNELSRVKLSLHPRSSLGWTRHLLNWTWQHCEWTRHPPAVCLPQNAKPSALPKIFFYCV